MGTPVAFVLATGSLEIVLLYTGINWVSSSFKRGSTKISIENLVKFSRDGANSRYGLVSLISEH